MEAKRAFQNAFKLSRVSRPSPGIPKLFVPLSSHELGVFKDSLATLPFSSKIFACSFPRDDDDDDDDDKTRTRLESIQVVLEAEE